MGQRDDLVDFTREALRAGRSREEIGAALGRAGWTPDEVEDALGAFAEEAFAPPIPKPRAYFSARDFFVYALIFICLVAAAGYLISLCWALIDQALDTERYGTLRRMRFAIAVLVVTVPAYIWLTRREEVRLRERPGLARSGVRRAMTYLAMLVAALTFAGDLIWVIYRLLSGGFALEFVLKAASIAVVSGFVFLTYSRKEAIS